MISICLSFLCRSAPLYPCPYSVRFPPCPCRISSSSNANLYIFPSPLRDAAGVKVASTRLGSTFGTYSGRRHVIELFVANDPSSLCREQRNQTWELISRVNITRLSSKTTVRRRSVVSHTVTLSRQFRTAVWTHDRHGTLEVHASDSIASRPPRTSPASVRMRASSTVA